jgi:hypothetical protein
MDSRTDCSPFTDGITGEGMKFVARYYSRVSLKSLTPAEAQQLSSSGVGLIAVFQDSNNSVDLFSTDIGESHADKALQLAAAIGEPADTAIYFAVDFDPTLANVQGPISDCFSALRNALAAAPAQYVLGVYGSGLTCRVLRDSGLAKFTWLSCSTGFREYSTFRRGPTLFNSPRSATCSMVN